MTKREKKKKLLDKKLREYKKYFIESNDAEWDWVYILSLFSYKLQRVAKFMETEANTLSAPKKAKELRKVSELFEKVIEFDYEDKYHKEMDAKYGKLKIRTKKIKGSDLTQWLGSRAKETPENTKQISKETIAGLRKADRDRQRDLDKALKLISKNLFGWWD